MTGSSSSDQVHRGGGVPLTLQSRKTGSLGFTTFSLKEDRIFGVPSVVGDKVVGDRNAVVNKSVIKHHQVK